MKNLKNKISENIFFSIIIPSYNQGSFIDRCLQSIVKQSFHEYEVIIQDNLSNDNTKLVLEKYRTHKNIHIYFEKDYGQADAINRGLKKAKGKWVTWQNCDDYFNNNCFVEFYNEIINPKNASFEIFYGDLNLHYHDKNVPDYRLRFYGVNFFTLLFEGGVVSNQCSFWKLDLHKKYGYIKNFYNSFDFEWFLRISKDNKFKKISAKDYVATFCIYKEQKSFAYSNYDKNLRVKIVNMYRGKIFSNIIIVILLNKISKIFRFLCLIISGDLIYLFKEKNFFKTIKNFFKNDFY
jgi:glycosyltransferase involved in cell wall biosynthesis